MRDEDRFKVRLVDGILYDPFHPSGPPPKPETVAHGLAKLCRYGGHVTRDEIYSVAEHSLWVAMRLGIVDNERLKRMVDSLATVPASGFRSWASVFVEWCDGTVRLALLGLIHDCPEGCGLVDVPGPVLRNAAMAEYKEAHKRCHTWLLDGWGIAQPTAEEAAAVKAVDTSILGAELAVRPKESSEKADGSGEDLPRWPGIDLAGRHDLSRLGSAYVRDAWVAAYYALRGVV